jgi:prophage regulatory protein
MPSPPKRKPLRAVSPIQPSELPQQERILRKPQVRDVWPVSNATLYRLIRAGEFPAPISLGGGRAVGWVEREVQEFLRGRIEKRDAERAG